jgi:hypothetical protein
MPHITFIHGLANKPPQDVLLRSWLDSLLGRDRDGLDLKSAGVTTEMVYWADVLYDKPEAADAEESDAEETRDAVALDALVPETLPEEERRFVVALDERLQKAFLQVEAETAEQNAALPATRAVPLPGFIERYLMRRLVRDAHHYLYQGESEPRPGEKFKVRDELRNRFIAAVRRGAQQNGPHVVVSHSMGTIIAYDCLKHVEECPRVDALVTLGSPLGLSEVQDGYGSAWKKNTGFPGSKLAADRWVNFYDRLDVVCAASPKLARDYRHEDKEVITDERVTNVGKWRHAIREYFARDQVRDGLKRLLNV